MRRYTVIDVMADARCAELIGDSEHFVVDESVGPWLVPIDGQPAWLTRLALETTARMTFIESLASEAEIVAHLRTLSRVRTEDGRILYFRYFDPRILTVFLPTCTGEQLAAFFGPIDAFIAESANGTAMLIFQRADDGLRTSETSRADAK